VLSLTGSSFTAHVQGLPSGVLHKDVDIRRASCLALKSICVAISTALSKSVGRCHEDAHTKTQWAARTLRTIRSGRQAATTASHTDADCSFLRACQAVASARLACSCGYQAECISEALSSVLLHLDDPRPRVALAAVGLLAEFGFGNLLRYFHLTPMAGSRAVQRANDVCAAMVRNLVSHGFAALACGSAPLMAAVTRAASACGKAFMLFECACCQALLMQPGLLFCQHPLKLLSGRTDPQRSSCIEFCRFAASQMLRLIDLAASCLIFCVSSGNIAYKHPALLALEAMMRCCTLDVLIALSSSSIRAFLSGSYAIRVRAAMRAVCAAYADAATRYSAEAVLQLHTIVAEKVRAYSKLIPALHSLPECLVQHWQTSGDAIHPSMMSWKFSNTLLPLRAHSLIPVVSPPLALGTACMDQALWGLYARHALLNGHEFPRRVVQPCMTQLLAAVGPANFSHASSLLVFGGTCPSGPKLDSVLSSLRITPKQYILTCIYRAQVCDITTCSARLRDKIARVILAIYEDYTSAAAQMMLRAAKNRKLRDEPFGIATTKVVYCALAAKTNPIINGFPQATSGRGTTNLKGASEAQGHINAVQSQVSNRQPFISAVYFSARQPLSLAIIDPDVVDSSKLGAERLIRRLHRCIGSFVIASTSTESTTMLPVR
jgi:hypothetical protein